MRPKILHSGVKKPEVSPVKIEKINFDFELANSLLEKALQKNKFRELTKYLTLSKKDFNERLINSIWSQSSNGADWEVMIPLLKEVLKNKIDVLETNTKILLGIALPGRRGLEIADNFKQTHGDHGVERIKYLRKTKQIFKEQFVKLGLPTVEAEKQSLHLLFGSKEKIQEVYSQHQSIHINKYEFEEIVKNKIPQEILQPTLLSRRASEKKNWRIKSSLTVNVDAAIDRSEGSKPTPDATVRHKENPGTQTVHFPYFGEKYQPTAENNSELKSLLITAELGNIFWVKENLKTTTHDSRTLNGALILAVKNTKNWLNRSGADKEKIFEIVDLILANGADINCLERNGETLLRWAMQNQHADFLQPLLDRGANINGRNHKGETLMMEIILHGRVNLLEYLLDRGADINQANNAGETVLDLVVKEDPKFKNLNSEEQNRIENLRSEIVNKIVNTCLLRQGTGWTAMQPQLKNPQIQKYLNDETLAWMQVLEKIPQKNLPQRAEESGIEIPSLKPSTSPQTKSLQSSRATKITEAHSNRAIPKNLGTVSH